MATLEHYHDLHQQGDIQAALEGYLKLLEKNPQQATLHHLVAIAYFQLGKLDEAIHAYQSALHLKPGHLDARYNLAIAQMKANQWEQAKDTLDTLLQAKPEHFGALYQMGYLYMRARLFEQAIPYFQRAEKIELDHLELQINLGHCYLHTKENQGARDCYRIAMKLDPNDAELPYNLGVIAGMEGYENHAINYYKQAIEINEDHLPSHTNLAILYQEKNHLNNALHHFERALALKPEDKTLQYKIGVLKKDHRLSAAPTDYIKTLFDQYADHYDQHLLDALDYKVPELLLQLYHTIGLTEKQTTLDLGCGTGLCGQIFKPAASHLSGVDISPHMLAEAHAKHCYEKLYQEDLLSFLKSHKDQYQLITAGDVFVYFGKLEALFASIAQRLHAGGHLIFNIEQGNTPPYRVDPSGRFKHHADYIKHVAFENKLDMLCEKQCVTRQQNNQAVNGMVYVLRKTMLE